MSELGAETSAALPSPRNAEVVRGPADDRNEPRTMRCPTCRAVQEWSDECRRCKCDLTFLRDVQTRYVLSRQSALRALRAGRSKEATFHALHAHWLHPNRESQQLLAVCALFRTDWVTALKLASAVDLS